MDQQPTPNVNFGLLQVAKALDRLAQVAEVFAAIEISRHGKGMMQTDEETQEEIAENLKFISELNRGLHNSWG